MEYVPDYPVYTTARNIDQYANAFGKTREGLLTWLKNKDKILNIASGGGILEKEFQQIKESKSPTQIYSLDITYGSEKGLEFPRYSTHLLITERDIAENRFKTKVDQINSAFEKKSIAASFENLPFGDNSFEGILASYAFVHVNDPSKLAKLYKEIYRVLKPGGESLITVARNILPFELPFKISEIQTHGTHSFISLIKPESVFLSLPKSS